MIASEHIKIPANNSELSNYLSEEDKKDIEKEIEILRKNLLTNPEKVVLCGDTLCTEAIESLIEVLSHGIHYAKLINNFNNKME